MIFNIDSTMKHSYSNDDTCFSIDVIDEILEKDFDALLDESSKILHSIEGIIIVEKLFAEFDEFMRCEDAHLVLNWEKYHFMVKEGIVLGHKVSEVGPEVDKAKINAIYKLPSPNNIKDSALARFNIIITSLKALDEGYYSKNYVREFLRALHPKWRAKVTTIEESKDLTSPSLDELIGNLKVLKMITKKDFEIVKAKVERKSLALKAKKESCNEKCLTSGSKEEEYAMANVQNHQKIRTKELLEGSWSDSGEEDDEKFKMKRVS
nr:reverse transcriptase domain-containing protein [Tanacetum cinerariifolium]